MIAYKLTDQALQTYRGYQWELGKEHRCPGKGRLCSSGWLHYYHSPYLAVLLNPIHADINNPRLWECRVSGKFLHDYVLKSGCTRMVLVRELPIPQITLNQRIAFAILCAKEVYKEPSWVTWANNWLRGVNRSNTAAYAAAAAANTAAYATAYAAEAARAAANAGTAAYAYAAANAAKAAAYATAAAANTAAYATAYAARAAAYAAAEAAKAAAYAAANAAKAAAYATAYAAAACVTTIANNAAVHPDLVRIAEHAMNEYT